jgi:CBS domain-containing protein
MEGIMFQSVNIQDHMLSKLYKVCEDENLLDAIEMIIENKISGLCVVNANDELVGILSELDCLQAILSAIYNESGIGKVKDVMFDKELIVAHPNEDIVNIAQDMLDKKQRRRPVIQDGKLVGQITCRQLLSSVRNFHR